MSNKPNHTPGPWVAAELTRRPMARTEYNWYVRTGEDRDSETIAIIPSEYNAVAEDELSDANARLIAAAPELLDALRICERLADTVEFEGCAGRDYCNCQRCCALRSARTAIAKAEGAL